MEIISKLMELVGGLDGMIGAIAIVVELLFRFIPSEKPKSLIYTVASIIKGMGALLTKIGETADRVLPQKIKHNELG